MSWTFGEAMMVWSGVAKHFESHEWDNLTSDEQVHQLLLIASVDAAARHFQAEETEELRNKEFGSDKYENCHLCQQTHPEFFLCVDCAKKLKPEE